MADLNFGDPPAIAPDVSLLVGIDFLGRPARFQLFPLS
jgi:hypothetical protein